MHRSGERVPVSRSAILRGRLNRWLVAAAAAASCVAGCRAPDPHPPGAVSGARGDTTAARADTVVVQVSDTDTFITLSNRSWWRPFPLDDYVRHLDHPASRVLDRRWGEDGRLYLLVRSVDASRPEPIGGFCASGEEMHINWLAADSTMRVVKEASVLVASCLAGRALESGAGEMAGEPWRLRFRMQGDTLGTVEYDPRHPERGLRTTSVPDTLRV